MLHTIYLLSCCLFPKKGQRHLAVAMLLLLMLAVLVVGVVGAGGGTGGGVCPGC